MFGATDFFGGEFGRDELDPDTPPRPSIPGLPTIGSGVSSRGRTVDDARPGVGLVVGAFFALALVAATHVGLVRGQAGVERR